MHRVIRSSGYVAEEFTPGGTQPDAAGVRDRLQAVGVRIDSSGEASPAKRVTVEDWYERGGGRKRSNLRVPETSARSPRVVSATLGSR